MPVLSSSGEAIAYATPSGKGDSRLLDTFLETLGEPYRQVRQICRRCVPLALSETGAHVLGVDHQRSVSYRVFSLFDTTSGSTAVALESDRDLFHPDFSPDDRWITFLAQIGPEERRLFVAPLQETPTPKDHWIQIGHGSGWEDKPRWSRNGDRVYFTSDRDGFMCLWAQELDRQTKQPIRPPFPVHHFHSARRSLRNVSLAWFEVVVARNRIVLNMADVTGNIWLSVPESTSTN